MNYYDEIKRKLIDNEIYSKVKDYSKEMNKINTYFEIGKLLNEVGKKYNRSTLFRMKQFYNVFNNEKVAPVVRQLSWSHCLILLPLKDINKINYYINQISNRNLSKRQLQDIIKSKEYERLPINTKNKLINKEKINAIDLVKNPIHIKNSKNKEIISEKILQKLILEDISTFLKELGNGFTFIDNEYKIKLDDRYNYIDLLLYNIKHKCYVIFVSFFAFNTMCSSYIIFDEFYESECLPERIAQENKRYGTHTTVMDFAIKRPDRDGKSLWDTLIKLGMRLIESNKDEMNNIVTVNSLFKQKRLFICSNCVNLIWELKNYKFKEAKMGAEKNLDETPIDKDNHAIDALLYLIQAILTRKTVSDYEKAERKSLAAKTKKRTGTGLVNYG